MTFNILPFKKRASSNLIPIMSIQQQMNEVFDRFLTDWDVFPSLQNIDRFPSLNVSETDKEVSIQAELPGMEEKDIKIEVNKNQLTIKGFSKQNHTHYKQISTFIYRNNIATTVKLMRMALNFQKRSY